MSIRIHATVSILFAALVLLLGATSSFAHNVSSVPTIKTTHSVQKAQTAGIRFKLIYQNGFYEVYMTPDATPAAPNATSSAQVTFKVAHKTGADRFDYTNLQSAVAGTSWGLSARTDAPVEAPQFDYISFYLNLSKLKIFNWTANTEVKVFSFESATGCPGPLSLFEQGDPFSAPNQEFVNTGNEITLVQGIEEVQAYSGNYGSSVADCSSTPTPTSTPTATPVSSTPTATPVSSTPTATPVSSTPTATPVSSTPTATPVSSTPTAMPVSSTPTATPVSSTPTATPGSSTPTATPGSSTPTATPKAHPDLVTSVGQPNPALTVGLASNLPVTVLNQGDGVATGPIQTTITLPDGISAPDDFTQNGWACHTLGQVITCANSGPLNPHTSSTFNLPVTPDASIQDTFPGPFIVTTDNVLDETETDNNDSTPLIPITAVKFAGIFLPLIGND